MDLQLVEITVLGEPWFRVVNTITRRLWGAGPTPELAWEDAEREIERYRRRGE
jgi:hypothetical protein